MKQISTQKIKKTELTERTERRIKEDFRMKLFLHQSNINKLNETKIKRISVLQIIQNSRNFQTNELSD